MPFLLMLKAKANVLLLQKSSQINNKFKRDTWEGRGIQRSPREKVETPPIRWLPILPALFALVALILASLCLLAGSRPGYMGDYAILTVSSILQPKSSILIQKPY
jgi:hypothetical protein